MLQPCRNTLMWKKLLLFIHAELRPSKGTFFGNKTFGLDNLTSRPVLLLLRRWWFLKLPKYVIICEAKTLWHKVNCGICIQIIIIFASEGFTVSTVVIPSVLRPSTQIRVISSYLLLRWFSLVSRCCVLVGCRFTYWRPNMNRLKKDINKLMLSLR